MRGWCMQGVILSHLVVAGVYAGSLATLHRSCREWGENRAVTLAGDAGS